MKIEVVKAKAFDIDPSKSYLAIYSTHNPVDAENAKEIKKAILDIFDNIDANVIPVVVSEGELKIVEAKKVE